MWSRWYPEDEHSMCLRTIVPYVRAEASEKRVIHADCAKREFHRKKERRRRARSFARRRRQAVWKGIYSPYQAFPWMS